MDRIESFVRWIPIAVALVCAGCDESGERLVESKLFYWRGSDPRVGSMSASEVADIVREIGSREYPVDARELYPITPDEPEPVTVWSWDGMQTSEASPIGGIVQDYWLNDSHVLRVTTAYFRSEKEEVGYRNLAWASVLTASEAYDERLNQIHTKHIDMIHFEYE